MHRETIDTYAQSSLVKIDDQRNREQGTDQETQAAEIQDVYVLIVREREEREDAPYVVESTPVPAQKASFVPAYVFCSIYLLCILATLAFQLYCITNPEIATVTIVPKTQQVTLSGTVQMGRILAPLTVSQSQTGQATGRGHQDARAAVGTVTFYNGQQTSQTVAAGTIFTGQSGVRIATTQQAVIPPGNPGTGYGTTTVTAQALQAGTSGNIQTGDVNTPIALAVFVRNNQFTGGQVERIFTTVTQHDIHSISTVLKTTLAKSMQGALQGQLMPQEQLQLLPCSPTVTSDHQPGAEATQVKVTVSATCSSVAYNSRELENKATALLTIQAAKKLTGYSLFGTPHVQVTQAAISSTAPHLVFLSFKARGTWIYGISNQAQERIKNLIAGKTTQQAEQLLATLPGVAQSTIRFSGFWDATRIPKQSKYIYIVEFVS